MKKQLFRALVLSGVCLMAAASARAQVYTAERAVMDIPFDFNVGETRLKAGRYVVGHTPTLLLISREDGRQSVRILPASTRQPRGELTAPKLVLRRYGERYFLAEAWMSTQGLGYELPRSRAEREEMAKDSAAGREVTLIARR